MPRSTGKSDCRRFWVILLVNYCFRGPFLDGRLYTHLCFHHFVRTDWGWGSAWSLPLFYCAIGNSTSCRIPTPQVSHLAPGCSAPIVYKCKPCPPNSLVRSNIYWPLASFSRSGGNLAVEYSPAVNNIKGLMKPNLAPPPLDDIVSVAPGAFHCVALRQDGNIVAWGSNAHGQLEIPESLTDVAAVCSGRHHSLALTRAGIVIGWGQDRFGQSCVPSTLNDVVMIAAGRYHSLAMRSDGTVVAWGHNQFGQCEVPGELERVVNIFASDYCSMALKSNGSVVQWGASSMEVAKPVQA